MRNTRTIEARVGVWLASLLALLALPIAMLAAPVTAQAAGKVSVAMSVEVAAAPADVWKTIGGFDRLQDWHPAVESTTMNGSPTTPGSSRVLHLKGGGEIHETLTSYSDSLMRYTYKIDQSPLPVADYESYLAVTETGSGHSLVIWGSTFDPAGGADAKKAKSVISGIYQAGFDTLTKKFGGAGMAKPHKAKASKKKM